MRKTAVLLISVLTLLAVSGCGPGAVRNASDDTSAMIFGHVDMSESSARIIDVSFMKHPPKAVGVTMKRYFNDIGNMRVYKNGTFFAENIKPGKYRFQGFHSKGADYYMGKDDENIIDVKPGSIYYVGSFKYKSVKSSRLKLLFLREGKFGLEIVGSPSEAELIEEIIQYVKGTNWEDRLLAKKKKLARKK